LNEKFGDNVKLIILSAGRGERLYPLTNDIPKPLLDIGNGKTLLEEQIERFHNTGVIHEIIIVIGYHAEKIEQKILPYQNMGMKIKTIYNPFFDLTNNLVSLWLAKEEMTESFLITNGDNIFNEAIIENFVNTNKEGIILSMCRKSEYDEDDMKVKLKNNCVDHISKKIEKKIADGESPGLLLVEGLAQVKYFKERLDKIIREPIYLNSFWLELLNDIVIDGNIIKIWEFDGEKNWQEVDTYHDLELIKKFISSSNSI